MDAQRKRETLSTVLIDLVILCEYYFFYVIPFPETVQKFVTYKNKSGLLILIFLAYIGIRFFDNNAQRIGLFSVYVAIFTCLAIVSAVYCITHYSFSKNELLVPFVAYISILWFVPLTLYLRHHLGHFILVLTSVNLIAGIILIFQGIYFLFRKNVFLHIYELYQSGLIPVRNGQLRITYLGTVISLSCVISIGILFNHETRNQVLHVANILVSFVYFVFVSQTRMYIVCLLLVMTVQFVKKNMKLTANNLLLLYSFIIAIVLLYFLIIRGYISSIIAPLIDGSYQTNGSYYARMDAITYFINIIKSHLTFGLGILDPGAYTNNYTIFHGPTGFAMMTDVGLLGSVARMGIPILVWYVLLLTKLYRLQRTAENYVLSSLFYFILFSSFSLIVLDPQRIFFLSSSLAVFNQLITQRREADTNE